MECMLLEEISTIGALEDCEASRGGKDDILINYQNKKCMQQGLYHTATHFHLTKQLNIVQYTILLGQVSNSLSADLSVAGLGCP